MSVKKRWRRYHEQDLKKYYKDPNMTVEEMAEKMDRTANAIRLKASRLKLRRPYEIGDPIYLDKECYGRDFDPDTCVKDDPCSAWVNCSTIYYKRLYGVG